jgi:hypothetical protein
LSVEGQKFGAHALRDCNVQCVLGAQRQMMTISSPSSASINSGRRLLASATLWVLTEEVQPFDNPFYRAYVGVVAAC